MRRYRALILVITGILAVLVILVVVAVVNGGEAERDLEPSDPQPSSAAS